MTLRLESERPDAMGHQSGSWAGRWRVSPVSSRPTHILIASMPKSGSTFLSNVIRELPGFRRALLVPDTGRREQELDPACLSNVDEFSYVAQHHVRYSDWTAELCRRHHLKPVVLVRSLLDVVVSLRDHIRRESTVLPTFFAEPRHAQLDDATLERMIARLALPWYINFYMGWRQAPDTLLLDYEQLTAAPAEAVDAILRHSGVVVAASEIDAALGRVLAMDESRFNVGVSGRGADLQPDTIRGILELIELYPEAADDPYVRSLRSQALDALSGNGPTQPRVTASAIAVQQFKSPRWRLGRKTKRLMMRRAAPVGLLILACMYWIWPNDLIPDVTRAGYLDDAVVMFGLAFLGGRLTKYK